MLKYIANIITTCRILGSVLLLFPPTFSIAFYIIYTICGFSDMIDGTIARKTKSTSEFGNKLDTAADLVFVIASFIKILPAISLPEWLWVWSIVIAIIKVGNIIFGYFSKKHFISLHSTMNKITGLLLFLLPLTLAFVDVKYTSIVVCTSQPLPQSKKASILYYSKTHARSKTPSLIFFHLRILLSQLYKKPLAFARSFLILPF